MPVLLAASRPATTALARIRSRQRNSCIDLPPQTQIAATKESRSSPATSSTPARNPLDRVLSTQAHHPRRSNPHSARGTTTRSPIAVSFLGGFRNPAAQVCGPAFNGWHPKPFTTAEVPISFDHLVGATQQREGSVIHGVLAV